MSHPSPATPPPVHRPDAPDPVEPAAPDAPAGPDTSTASAGSGAPAASGDSDAPVEPAGSGVSVEPVGLCVPEASADSDAPVARAGSESGWSPRLGRLGAARPVPAAGRAQWFGVPLVPLLVAALVAGAFLAARGGTEQGLATGGRPGGDQVGAPSPAGDGEAATTPSAGQEAGDTHGRDSGAPGGGGPGTRGDDTPSDDTATAEATVDGTPTRTVPADPSARPDSTVTGVSPTPSRTGSAAPTPRPPATATHTGTPARPVSFEALGVGDCFDIDRDAPGTALRRSCDTPHNAELVARLRLTGVLATDAAIREAATLLCREPLRRKAALQPLGTRWTTFVQYPYRTSYLLGSATVACSLAAPSATGGKLSRPLL
ncbi:hypothetical protein [Streptomyces sp. NPDC048266]|uniref:hypothetical protein n=1 Tax=Streptomyces sp. NPDC048266 TaxID=3155787 RepID=UPI0033E34495